ncbi:hypothetical protein [Flavobacterium hungaricum]|uniref:CarboxypepD_reg-like domain-containing protein n=1 Tax=Flavobacterium hungaricum TaxID=2082725 RepID=A0ABR9TEW3_9FLAO|nr:hypothetical protein [Flavobacterium hungaricum]MBE8723900.1 hypothetical protein [Flavobacterium hungaricum]
MRITYVFVLLLFCSCTNNKFYSYVYDYDTGKPLKNVLVTVNGVVTATDSTGFFTSNIKSNADCVILLQKEEYAVKKIYRKPDSLGMFSKRNLNKHKIYLFKKESDFSNKRH